MAMTIQVFEWETLHVRDGGLHQHHFNSLVKWQDSQRDNYFRVGHKKLTFTQWVGVIQVSSLVIEVLPKADPNRYEPEGREESVKRWKGVLVGMLRKTGRLKVRTSDNTNLAVYGKNGCWPRTEAPIGEMMTFGFSANGSDVSGNPNMGIKMLRLTS